jgi:FkbM family methyltransferase
MMIPLQEVLKKHNLSHYNAYTKGIIVIGAHWAEEHDDFVKMGAEKFVYVEPCKQAFEVMVQKVITGKTVGYLDSCNSKLPYMTNDNNSIICFRCACGEEEQLMPMYVSHQNQGQSNSLLKPNLHTVQHPSIIFDDAEVVSVYPLDMLPFEKSDFSLLYMDVQGAEGLVLKGATKTLEHINIIYTECNRDSTYEGNMLIDEMDSFLADKGFKRIETHWPSPDWSWGDCIYVREKIFERKWVSQIDITI